MIPISLKIVLLHIMCFENKEWLWKWDCFENKPQISVSNVVTPKKSVSNYAHVEAEASISEGKEGDDANVPTEKVKEKEDNFLVTLCWILPIYQRLLKRKLKLFPNLMKK